ncbi:ribosome small subunit-dependent GTPase A [Patescibacteria group bacterium]
MVSILVILTLMLSIARVIAEHKNLFIVNTDKGICAAKITGKMNFTARSREDYPVVGDFVKVSILDKENAVIKEILPRKTILKRKTNNKFNLQYIAANIDVAFIIQSVDRDFNLNRIGRYLTIIREGGIKPVVILNKIDLITDTELNTKLSQINVNYPHVKVLTTSVISNNGISSLINYIKKDKTYCFLGSSGVGKSSLINKLVGQDILRTNNLRLATGKGKHTTTNRQLIVLANGSMVVDNPGMRELGIAELNKGIKSTYEDIEMLTNDCKFKDCTHASEPGCKIQAAIKNGTLEEKIFDNYQKIVNENKYFEMTKLEKREKDRKFGKFVKTVMKQKKRTRPESH